MSEREELAALRRMAELEARAGSGMPAASPMAAPEPKGLMGEVGSYLSGMHNGLYAIPQGALRMGARATDALGISDNAYKMVDDVLGDSKSKDKFGKAGDFVGSAIGTLPLMGMGPLAGGAATGAALSEQPSLVGAGMDAATGGIMGKSGDMAARGLAHVLSPVVSHAARTLMGEGVRLTPGQMLGGALQRTEDKLSSVPFLGDAIANARIRGIEDFNRASINRSIAPIGAQVPTDLRGRAAVDYAHQQLSDNYNRLLGNATFSADQAFAQNVGNITNSASMIPQYGAQPIQDFIQTNIAPRMNHAGQMSGREFKEVDELLGREIRDYTGGSPNDRKMARAFEALQNEWRDTLGRTNPHIQQDLADTNTGWANLVRIENAAARNGGPKGVDPGTFSPSQLGAAVRDTDRSARKNAYARGDALMQDLSDAGLEVLPQQVPDSGTAGRMAAMMLAGGGLGGLVSPVAAAPIAALTAGYTRPGIAAGQYLLGGPRSASSRALGSALRQAAPAAAPSAAMLGALLSQGGQ